MVAISWRMSTACWAAACFSARSLGGILGGQMENGSRCVNVNEPRCAFGV
jgi:hypothetical protein